MSIETTSRLELVSHLPENTLVTFHDVSWEEYEEFLRDIGEARGLRVSYDDGKLQVMTISSEHESYAWFIGKLMATISLRLRIEIRFFGSATIKKKRKKKGNEPDACFYVQSASVIGNKVKLDFETDPPPDIALEIDIHHESRAKLPIYAALGVPEVWIFDGRKLTIYLLRGDQHVEGMQSRALPMLSDAVLTDFLTRMPKDGELKTLLAFEQWVMSQPPRA
jgi:Uma2 family endonuclease